MYKIGGDEMVACPYNCYHIISKLRIQKHIMKCKKNYPEVKLAPCFYNYTHRLKPEEMLEHYSTCSHKARLDEARYCKPTTTYTSCHSPVKNEPQFFSVKPDPLVAHYMQENYKGNLSKKINNFSDSSDEELGGETKEQSNTSKFSEGKERKGFLSQSSDDDDDLEPLPLPKTVSKAFTCADVHFEKQEQTRPKQFGRGKNFLNFSSNSPKPNYKFALRNFIDNGAQQSRASLSETKSSCYPESFSYDFVDDSSTLKSDIVTEEDDDDEYDGDDDGEYIYESDDDYNFVLNGLNSSVKI